jgi:phenylpyruvate tautomerase PptA (4-oxalocrotonate tautomerase family)
MPLVTIFNLRSDDPLADLEATAKRALTSMPELAIKEHEIDLVPVLQPERFDAAATRVNVDIWERPALTKDVLQELAERLARAVQTVVGEDRTVKVVIRPYDVQTAGWVSV